MLHLRSVGQQYSPRSPRKGNQFVKAYTHVQYKTGQSGGDRWSRTTLTSDDVSQELFSEHSLRFDFATNTPHASSPELMVSCCVSLPSVESDSRMLWLSWSCNFLMYVIPVHSIKQSLGCITLLGSGLISVSFSEHSIAPTASRSGDSMPKDNHMPICPGILSRINQKPRQLPMLS